MLTRKIHPLWKIDPSLFVALDADSNLIATGHTKEDAKDTAIFDKKKHPWFVTPGWFVRRPILDEKNLIAPSIVLFGNRKWQDGKLFVVKKWELFSAARSDDNISLQGMYLDELLEHPYLMLCKQLQGVTVNTNADLKWERRAWAPVMNELDPYLPAIQKLCKMNIFDASLSNANVLNKEVKDGFKELLEFTKKGFPAPKKEGKTYYELGKRRWFGVFFSGRILYRK